MLRKCAHVITNQVNNMPPTEEGEDPGKDLISIFQKFKIDIIMNKAYVADIHMFEFSRKITFKIFRSPISS